jgi:hypothetical protein
VNEGLLRGVWPLLIYDAHLMHVPGHWIVVGSIVLLGLGVLSGVKSNTPKGSIMIKAEVLVKAYY